MASKIREVVTPEKPTKAAWLRRFTYLVETSLREDPQLRPRAAGTRAADQLRKEWGERFPEVGMPQGWIAL